MSLPFSSQSCENGGPQRGLRVYPYTDFNQLQTARYCAKGVVLLGPRGSLRPRHPSRASSFFLATLVLALSRAPVDTPYGQVWASDEYPPLPRAWEPHDCNPETQEERPWRGPGAWLCVCGVTLAPPAWRQRH